MPRSQFLVAGTLIPGLLYAAPILASAGSSAALPPEYSSREPKEAKIDVPFAGSVVADDTQLAGVTGKDDVNAIQQAINVKNTSTVSGNTINGDPVTGTISIDGASFSGFNGLALVSANTGNNVSINSSMNVNVGIQQ